MKAWISGVMSIFRSLLSSRRAREEKIDRIVHDIHARAEQRIADGSFGALDTIKCNSCKNVTLKLTRRSVDPDGIYWRHYICTKCAHSEDYQEVKRAPVA